MVLLRRTDGAVLTATPRTVLLLATTTGYQIRSFGQAAEALGVQLVFASDRCDQLDDPWWDRAIPVRFHDDLRSVEAISQAFAGAPPHGIVAVGDRPAALAARVAAAFGMPGNPPSAADASRNKLASRHAFRAAGLPTPWFRAVSVETPIPLPEPLPYPVVLKPLALSGSRGVMRVDDEAGFVDAFGRLRDLLQVADIVLERDEASHFALIESFIPGSEFAAEALLDRGQLRVLAIFDKPDPLDGPFFEETIYVTPSRAPQDVQARIESAVAGAARALGLFHGPVHAECRVTPAGEVFVLEVAARPIGGLCSKALRFVGAPGAPAVALEEVLLRHAVGEDVSAFVREPAASAVMMIPIPQPGVFRGVSGVDEARAVDGIVDIQVTAKPDARLVPLPEGRSYLGFIFARAAGPTEAELALRRAHQRLQFTIDRNIPVR